MKLSVTGKQIDVGDALRSHIESTIDGTVSKYFDNAIEGSVVIAKHGRQFRADISVHIGHNFLLQGHCEADDAYAAFDTACQRIATRLRRHKSRLRDRRRLGKDEAAEVLVASQYILKGDEEEAEHADNPVVVAEMATEIDTLTVGEAVMRMDLADVPAMLFRNRAHGGLNMVYRRNDGHVGWIDPQSNSRQNNNARAS